LSGTSGFSDLAEVLVRFDTVVLMKVGPELEQIANTLTELGLLDQAVYVSRATMPEQRIERDLRCVLRERGDCFAMVVIKKYGRSGVLLGECTAEASTQESSHV
jgi:precorrin-2/cobalt-factor-2 C20-methyltransferase